MEHLAQLLQEHFRNHPGMELRDAIKFLYQSSMGGGHLIADPRGALARLEEEWTRTEGAPALSPTEPLGGGLCRLSLAACKGLGLAPSTVFALFLRGTEEFSRQPERLDRSLELLYRLPFPPKEIEAAIRQYRAAGLPMVGHSTAYRQAFSPAYRVVLQSDAALLPLLAAIDRSRREHPPDADRHGRPLRHREIHSGRPAGPAAKAPRRGALWGVTAASFAVIAAGTFWLTSRTGVYDERIKSYLHLFTAVLAAALFLLARSYGEGRSSGRALTALSGLSFGVYLVHPMAIQFWQKAWTAWITPAVDTIPLQLGYYLAILLSCLVGVALLMSVKPLCWLFTGQSFSSACRECNLFALFRRNPSKQTPAS